MLLLTLGGCLCNKMERFLNIIFLLFEDTLCIPLNMHVCELSMTDRRLSCVFNSSGVYEADRSLEGITLLSVQLRSSNIQASLRLDTASWVDLE